MQFLKHLFTDSQQRPEVKNVLGVVASVAGFVYLFLKSDVSGFLAIQGFSLACLGLTTAGDAIADKAAQGGK